MSKITQWPDYGVIRYYLRLRHLEERVHRRRQLVRQLLLMRLKRKKGRIVSRNGTALLRSSRRITYDRETIERLIWLGMLEEKAVAPARTETLYDQVFVNGLPEAINSQEIDR